MSNQLLFPDEKLWAAAIWLAVSVFGCSLLYSEISHRPPTRFPKPGWHYGMAIAILHGLAALMLGGLLGKQSIEIWVFAACLGGSAGAMLAFAVETRRRRLRDVYAAERSKR